MAAILRIYEVVSLIIISYGSLLHRGRRKESISGPPRRATIMITTFKIKNIPNNTSHRNKNRSATQTKNNHTLFTSDK